MENRNNLVKEWISKAEHDIGMAKLALDYKPEYTDAICFHCQQAVEKYLKAFLTYLNIDFKKSHSLSYLLDLIAEKVKITEELYAKADQLESYAVKIRYPVEWPEPSIEEATEAYNHVLYFKKMFLEQMGLNEEI